MCVYVCACVRACVLYVSVSVSVSSVENRVWWFPRWEERLDR